MCKKFLWSLMLLLWVSTVTVHAAAVPRLMFGQIRGKVKLSFDKEPGVKKSYATWTGVHADKIVMCQFIPSDTWKEGRATVVPQQSGFVGLEFTAGPSVRKGVRYADGCYFDNIRINGELLPNGDFEKGGKGFGFYVRPNRKEYPARIVCDPSVAKSGNNCLAVWHDGFATRQIQVKAGVPVTVTFDYKNAGELPPANQINDFYPLSLEKAANMGFTDEIPGDGKGGWTDQGPANDLRALPPGVYRFQNCPIRIIAPASNNGKSCVVLKSVHSPWGKESAAFELNGKYCNRLYLLTGLAWGGVKGGKAAEVTVHFQNGTSKVYPLIVGKHVGDWWNPPKTLPQAELVWQGTAHANTVGLYLTSLRLPVQQVRSVTISTVPDNRYVLSLVGATAAMIRSEDTGNIKTEINVRLPKASRLIALPLDTLLLDLRKRNIDPGEFFNGKNLARIRAFDEKGEKLKLAVAKFDRQLAPVLLLSSFREIQSLQLKSGAENATSICTPREALKRIAGNIRLAVNDTPWANGIMLNAADFKLKNAELTEDEDSFYQQMLKCDPNGAELHYDFELAKPETLKLFSYVRQKSPPTSQTNSVAVFIDDLPKINVGGVYYKSLACYWGGGAKVKLNAGKHKLRITVPRTTPENRHDFRFAKFYMSNSFHAPEYPGFAAETAALQAAGFSVFGVNKAQEVKNIPSTNPLRRIVNEERSYPDLTGIVTNRIDERGSLHTAGRTMRFADGTELDHIWGRNIGILDFYRFWKEERLGAPGAIDEFIKRYKSMGISTLRLFFSSMPRAEWTNQNNIQRFLINGKKLEFHPDFLKSYQLLIAAAYRHGIYLKITFGAYPWSLREITPLAQAMFYDRRLIDLQKKRMDILLNTPNPYRNNIKPADDPTIAILEIENEVNFRGAGLGGRVPWHTISQADKKVLYPLWHNYLQKKYQNIDQLRKQWGHLPLIDKTVPESFSNIDFAPVWNVSEWGQDHSDFKVNMDDLRVTSASFGKEKRSNGAVSDMFEFMYRIYDDYLQEMYTHIRSRGFKGVITTCGPDTENFYIQRTAANKRVDAVSGGTGYWNRDGYSFLRSLNWLDAMIYTTYPDKPMITREYGANLKFTDCWWGNLIAAAVQKSMGKAYLFDFAGSIPASIVNPDYFYPDDAHENYTVNLIHDAHFYSHFSNLAAAIAVTSDELQKSNFRMEIGVPFDNVCYSAPFRGYNKLTFNNYAPFLYHDTTVRTFDSRYDGNADLVINEPALPTGDYSSAKNFFAVRPHSAFDRYGKPESEWFKNKKFSADGFIDTKAELDALYDAIIKAGGKMPVTREEYCKVWRDTNKKLEIDTRTTTFTGNTAVWSAFIGNLKYAPQKTLRHFTLAGTGDAWSFFGKIPNGDLFFGILNGKADLKETRSLNYIMAGTSDLKISSANKPFASILAGTPVNTAFKTNEKNLLTARKIYVTFFRTKSCQLPAEITFYRPIRNINACNRDGKIVAKVPFSNNTFANIWQQNHLISYYEVEFQ